ncbi:vegetative cell wall protein gp1-like [Acanthopagrus latus]|uniref:vegetative cell wall protein gp1-like n=1 Tax=Acanthopagrus latus TaxID=8177 RepID=UPI00187C0886|nr:vegetative cell wall protein gp1-like [Acanthopagrus latus]
MNKAHPSVLPLSQGGATQATNQEPEALTPAPLSPIVEQPQPGVPQQPSPQGGPQFMPPTQYYVWSPLGGSPMMIPLQPSFLGSQPANLPTLPQQPQQIFPPYTYFPVFSSPYGNQMAPPYGYPMIFASPLQQNPANQPMNSVVSPAVTPSGTAPLGNAPQPIQQQQNPQIVYMLQQPMNAALGSLSSEELQMAAKMGQLGVYMSSVLTNPSAGAVQPVNQAAGISYPDQQGIAPTSPAGIQQTQGPASAGSPPNTNPVGLKSPTQQAATVQTPAGPKLKPTQGDLV